ncbi:hypothetical protein C8J57DRAFT_1481244 [Mycena rebaudengoi]|nr:hypothetical protein C8J57DRAFT_1481244 [Mycena rebaudengoi]
MELARSILKSTNVWASVPQDWETVKREMKALVTKAAIATFLAGVQSQTITLSHQDNSTRVKVATNVLGLAGMLLDVSAACLALVASARQEQRIGAVERQLK